MLNATGDCCSSGLFDLRDGSCCKGKNVRLDRNGRCCDKKLDLCGVCGGKGVIDAQGLCCEVKMLLYISRQYLFYLSTIWAQS